MGNRYKKQADAHKKGSKGGGGRAGSSTQMMKQYRGMVEDVKSGT